MKLRKIADPPYAGTVYGARPPADPERPPRWARWCLAVGMVLVLAALLAVFATIDARGAEPAEVVTPSPYGYPPAAGILAWLGLRRRQHRCGYCAAPAELVVQAHPATRLDRWLATKHRTCRDHWPYAAAAAHRGLQR